MLPQNSSSLQLTVPECGGVFRYQPMTRINVSNFKPGEEPSDDWQGFVRNVMTLRPPYKQGGFLEPDVIGVLEWKVCHVV